MHWYVTVSCIVFGIGFFLLPYLKIKIDHEHSIKRKRENNKEIMIDIFHGMCLAVVVGLLWPFIILIIPIYLMKKLFVWDIERRNNDTRI